jgi:ferredoxin-type protein NapH
VNRARPRYRVLRRATQLAFALFYLALPFANAAGLRAVAGTPASTRIGPLDVVEPAAALTAILAGGTASAVGALLVGAAPASLVLVFLGPVLCSWTCPFGLVSELVDRARSRLARRTWRPWRPGEHERLRVPRVAFLAAVLGGSALLALPLGAILQGPRAISIAALEGVYLGSASVAGAGLLGVLLLADALLPRRLFCRALCPAGAVANFLRTRRTLRVELDPARCDCAGPGACLTACAWGIDLRSARRFDGCTNCLACLDACHSSALVPTARGGHARSPSTASSASRNPSTCGSVSAAESATRSRLVPAGTVGGRMARTK